MSKIKVGVFDSGVGGLSVADNIAKRLPNVDVIFRNDVKNMPYGQKTPAELLKYSLPKLKELQGLGCQIIVIACNTLSVSVIEELREALDIPLISVEPMVREAVDLSLSGIITVCATPGTLASKKYAELVDAYAQGINIIEPDCSDWAYLIEHNDMNENYIREDIEPSVNIGSDVIVVGCTHYHWIEDEIKEIVGDKAIVLNPQEKIISTLKREIGLLE